MLKYQWDSKRTLLFLSLVWASTAVHHEAWNKYRFEHTPLKVGGPVTELVHGEHLDNLWSDVPNSMRPPTLTLFYDDSPASKDAYNEFHRLANRNRLGRQYEEQRGRYGEVVLTKYDVAEAPKRLWYEYTPERNLTHRFRVHSLPAVVFFPRQCDGWTQWCDNGDGTWGGQCYVEQCKDWKTYSGVIDADKVGKGSFYAWARELIEQDTQQVEQSPHLESMEQQGKWIRSRHTTTTKEHIGNLVLPDVLPRFSELGFKAVPIPEHAYQMLLDFYHKNKHKRNREEWDSWGKTQTNFGSDNHPGMREESGLVESWIVDMQELDRDLKQYMLYHVIKPEVEKWIGHKLVPTSLYGQREYRDGSYLRLHLDRPDVLQISCTLSIYKEGNRDDRDGGNWDYLEVTAFDGKQRRAKHTPGTMIMYESATIAHGRPYRMPKGSLHVGQFSHFKLADTSLWSDETIRHVDSHQAKAVHVERSHAHLELIMDRRENWWPNWAFADQNGNEPSFAPTEHFNFHKTSAAHDQRYCYEGSACPSSSPNAKSEI